MDDPTTCVVIDASLRFARSNPELLAYAQEHARRAGLAVDGLLAEAIARVAEARAALEEGVDTVVREAAAPG